jgi:hypothetical protein
VFVVACGGALFVASLPCVVMLASCFVCVPSLLTFVAILLIPTRFVSHH